MIIVSVDPGISTGMAVYDSGRQLLELSTVTLDAAYQWLMMYRPDVIVCERMPVGILDQELQRGYQLILSAINKEGELHKISPGEWKPVAQNQHWKTPLAKTQHEKDAYCLLRYYFLTKLRKELGV